MTGTPKSGPLAFVAQLRARAAKGDKLAIAELAKLKAIGAQYKQVAMEMAANNAAEEVEGDDEDDDDEVLGEDSAFSGDKLEQADWVSRKYDNADGLVQKVRLRDQGWKGLNDVAKFMRIQPASVLQGALGGQQLVNYRVNPSGIQVVNWAGDDAETLPLTVTLAWINPPAAGDVVSGCSRPYAIVRFGTRGFSVEAKVDIGHGTQFTVSGSAITVQVVNSAHQNPGIGSGDLQLAGMLSFYPVVRTSPLTFTEYIDDADPDNPSTGVETVAVPAFAKSVMWLSQRYPATLTFKDALGGPSVYAYNIPASATPPDLTLVQMTPIPITSDITTITVATTPRGGGENSIGRLLFQLSI